MATAKPPRGKGERASSPEALSDPHNSLFAYTFGKTEHAAGLFRGILPPDLARRLRWDSLTREPGSFVDARLRWLHSDLLFSVRTVDTDEEVLIYLLIEHQSRPHPLMAYRVLGYVTRVWEDHLRKHRKSTRLPLVVPAVVYNGREPWSAARTLRELLDAPAPLVDSVSVHVPQSGYLLVDLRHGGADLLVGEALTALTVVTVLAMQTVDDPVRLVEGLRRVGGLVRQILAQPDGQAAFDVLMRYILATHEDMDRSELSRVVAEATDARAGESVVTVYEQLIEEGRQRGRAEGQAEALVRLLSRKFGAVSAEVQTRVQQAGEEQLAAWFDRVLTAATIDEVLGPVQPPRTARRAPRTRR